MTKPKGVFKKRVNKGNRFYKLSDKLNQNIVDQNNVGLPGPSERPRPTPVSASKRKLSSEYTKCSDGNINVVFDLKLLLTTITTALGCKLCGSDVTIEENITLRCGLASCFIIHCNNCEADTQLWSSELCENTGLHEINSRLFYGMRCIGKGLTPTQIFCGIMNLCAPLTKTNKLSDALATALQATAEQSMKDAVFEAVQINDTDGNPTLGLDIPIAFDASWQKRGHVSKNACATITSFDTGKVIDTEVLSKYCHLCAIQKDKAGPHNCAKNYEGTSGGMESTAAVIMFSRSQQTRGVRYVQFLGDGDSSAYKAVIESKPYSNVNISKLECVGHVQKRMGSRLRKLKSAKGGEKLSDGKSLKGAGRLTDSLIDKFQDYYGKAIRSNCNDVEKMRRAVWSIWFHRYSTDENPAHNLCDKTWCGYLKAKDEGVEYKHKPTPEPIMQAIKPIFADLANKELLKKCIHGKTQNANESFNNVIWSRVPKNTFVGRKVLELGVWDAICTYNDGCVSRLNVLKKFGMKDIGQNTEEAMIAADELRVRKAEIAVQQLTKEARTERRRKKLKLDNPRNEKDYKPGGF